MSFLLQLKQHPSGKGPQRTPSAHRDRLGGCRSSPPSSAPNSDPDTEGLVIPAAAVTRQRDRVALAPAGDGRAEGRGCLAA